MFRYTKTLKGIFGSYEDVAQISDLWNYLEGDLIDGLYEEEWYNLGTDKPFPCPDGEMIKGTIAIENERNSNSAISFFNDKIGLELIFYCVFLKVSRVQ